MVLKSYLSGLERTRVLLLVTILAAFFNGLLNYALIFGNWGAPELGIRGAAIASVLMNIATFLAMALYCAWVTSEHALFQRFWRPDWEAFARIFSLGWPIGLTMLSEAGLFSAISFMMGWLGTVELAAHGIALQLAALAFLVQVGLSQVATIRAGQALGHRDCEELRRGALVVIGVAACFALVAVALFLTIPEFLLGLFMDPADPVRPAVMAVGIRLLAVAALFHFADAGQVLALGLLRGVQDTKVPMFIAAVAYWPLGLGAAYVLGFVLGYGDVGIWLGLVVGLGVAAVLMMTRFWTTGLRAAVPSIG
jgi:MATE family multidrug resistance protein